LPNLVYQDGQSMAMLPLRPIIRRPQGVANMLRPARMPHGERGRLRWRRVRGLGDALSCGDGAARKFNANGGGSPNSAAQGDGFVLRRNVASAGL